MAELPDGLRVRLDPVLRDIAFARLVGVEIVDYAAAEASRSRRVASYRAEVRGEDDAVRCTALAVAFRTGRWHLGEDAWPADWRERY
jgi:hypothetical protein